MQTHTPTKRAGRRGERGIALVFTIFAIAALLVAVTGALVTGSANSKAAANYKGASQAHFVAESGLSRAIQNINATGVIDYQNEIVNHWGSRWCNGTDGVPCNAMNFAPLTGYTYLVTTTGGADTGQLISKSQGPDGVTNTVVANLVRSNQPITAPGAIYLATDQATNATFTGNSFTIDGNDHNYTGGMGPGLAVPGISTRNDTNTQQAVGSLNTQELDNVTGLGYQAGPPIVPSISTSPSAPTIAQMNAIITDLQGEQAGPGVVQTCTCVHNANDGCNSCNLGTAPPANPPSCKITTLQSSDPNQTVTIKSNGNITGCGVLIVNNDFDIQGTINFYGLILVKGQLTVTGSATLYGSVWAQGVDLSVGGNALVYNSSQALSLANQIIVPGAIPTPMKVTSIADCADLPAGSGGC